MGPSFLDKQTVSGKLPHNWPVRLGMDLATFGDMWRLKSLN